MALFADRADAGRDLAVHLDGWRDTDAVVVGIARGGVIVAAAVAAELELPLTAVAVRKLGMPGHEEVALGAIAEGVRIVDERILRRAGVDNAELAQIEKRERAVLARRQALIPAATPALQGRSVLLIDDGIATGATARAAARGIRVSKPATVILAVPVAPADWHPDETAAVDQYICAHPVDQLWAVGASYDDFTQTTDDDIARLLGTTGS
ncbi:hypothetical protein ET475_15315 [Microbacterium protaetiae]|uniref:Phosphoribosyltransferase domain-containing protein n=1 Tax=Microbacterium protaetiae TaxID=2509458 RepID=A0A4P6EI41_9MICO|nr:phosphoribosyltransferase family protein [Microbacterium protaetiae]QAY61213.1 hypothetical protein ET475_15315 [Microbacterium protaetiae]